MHCAMKPVYSRTFVRYMRAEKVHCTTVIHRIEKIMPREMTRAKKKQNCPVLVELLGSRKKLLNTNNLAKVGKDKLPLQSMVIAKRRAASPI